MRKRPGTSIIAVALVGAALLVTPWAVRAGPMDPPGPPGPTMKPLPDIEPRIGIVPDMIPFTITEPGSYYLISNMWASDTAITVAIDNVTIDLMGFTLIGPGKTSGDNYGVINGRRNVEIRNGTIREFGSHGVFADDQSNQGRDHRVIDLRLVSNGGLGIFLKSSGSLVRGCTSEDNGGAEIYAVDASAIIGNVSSDNGDMGIYGTRSLIIDNTVYRNSTSGIWAADGSTAARNTVSYNNQLGWEVSAGIKAADGSRVIGNTVTHSGQYNILAITRGNSIENNVMIGSNYGLRTWDCCNLYADNRSTNATIANYAIDPGCTDGGGNFSY